MFARVVDRRRWGRRWEVRLGYLVKDVGWREKGWTLRTEALARKRMRWLEDRIAEGWTARQIIGHLAYGSTDPRRLEDYVDEFIRNRRNVGTAAIYGYRKAFRRLGKLGGMAPSEITWRDISEWIDENSAGGRGDLAAASLGSYLGSVRMLLDFTEVVPNPARHRLVSAPRIPKKTKRPPPWADWCAIRHDFQTRRLNRMQAERPPYLALADFLEGTGARIEEAMALRWVDIALEPYPRVRLESKSAAGLRWVPLPAWVTATLDDLAGRPGERVFAGVASSTFRQALADACLAEGIGHYNPHLLRDRWITLQAMAGVPLPLISRMAGHEKSSTTTNVYTHANLIGEPIERLREFYRVAMLHAGGQSVLIHNQSQEL